MNIFTRGLFWGMLTFFLFGEIVGAEIHQMNRLKLSFGKALWLYVFIGISYLVYQGIIYGLILSVVGFFLNSLLGFSNKSILSLYAGLSSAMLGYFLFKWHFIKKEKVQILAGFIIAASLILVANIFSELFLAIFVTLLIGSVLFVPLAIATIKILLRDYDIQKDKIPAIKKTSNITAHTVDKKLIFIGLDGCDWRLLNRFLNEEKLPNIKKIIKAGVLGELKTDSPTDSPLLWNSVLTGKKPSEHGIVFWYKTKFPFLAPINKEIMYPSDSRVGKVMKLLIKLNIVKRIPLSTMDRKCKAIWNILSDYQKKSINVGWIYSWPAEKINGIQVSWYMYPFEEAAQEVKRFRSTNLSYRVYPENLLGKLADFIIRPADLTQEELAEMYFPTEKIDPKIKFADKANPWDYAKDKTFLKITDYLLNKQENFNYFSLYLYGIDAVCHTYWPFFPGATNNEKYKNEVLSVSNSKKFKHQAQSFDKCIGRYYEYIDEEIGRLIKKIGNGANIVIASDHGFDFDGTGHYNSPQGIFIASGPYIRKNITVNSISIYDILPTLLVLLGVPPGEDMEGRVMDEILSTEFLSNFPIQYIRSHEEIGGQNKSIDDSLDEKTRQGIENRLKALVYID